jgi:peptidoglycan/LPS O-acetylase OafA/YrhL
VGVDVFFVLSGFLITNLIDARLSVQDFSFAHFYERRARRILPALFITCLISLIAGLALLVPYDMREFAKSLKAAAFFYSNVVFERATGYFADPVSTRPLLHTWSLAVEEQFYLVFPPLLFVMHWASGRRRWLLWSGIGILFVLSLGFSVIQVRTDTTAAFYLLPARAWELLGGSLVALLPGQMTLARAWREVMAVLGALLIGISFAVYDRSTVFPGAAALLPCAGTVLIILANLGGATAIGWLLSLRALVYIGLLSYGLYLYHWPVLAFSRYFLDHELSAKQTAAALLVTTALAVISYYGVEVPVRSGRLLRTRARVFQASALGLLAIGAVGIAAVNAAGFPWRFSGAALQYANAAHDKWDWDRCMPPPDQLDARTVCKVGASQDAPPAFLVWGDSHADALAPGVDARAKSLGLSGWIVGYSRCPSLLGAAPIQHAKDDHPCALIADKVLALVRDSQISHVLLVSRWDTYISGWERGGAETTQDLTIAFTAADGRRTVGAEAFRLSFQETLQRLRAAGADVWVLEQVPPQLIEVPSALAKAIYLGRDPEALRRPFSQIEARRAAAESIFEDFRRSPGVSFIDPAEKFCPGKSPCLIAVDGHSLYADGNHLSVFGSVWSQAMLDPFFNSTAQ